MGDGDVLYMRKEKSGDDESSANQECVWDDTALIEAYDHAVSLAKSEVENRISGYSNGEYRSSKERSVSLPKQSSNSAKKSKFSQGPGPRKKWCVGDACRSSYSADGVLYEANITSVGLDGKCIVRYVGYDNEEEVLQSDLLPSRGQTSRNEQNVTANLEITPHATDTPKQHHRKESPSLHHSMDWEIPNHHQYKPSTSPGSYLPPPHLGLPQMMVPPPPPLNLLAASGCPSEETDALSAMLMSWYMSGFHTGYYQGLKQGPQAQTSRTSTRKK